MAEKKTAAPKARRDAGIALIRELDEKRAEASAEKEKKEYGKTFTTAALPTLSPPRPVDAPMPVTPTPTKPSTGILELFKNKWEHGREQEKYAGAVSRRKGQENRAASRQKDLEKIAALRELNEAITEHEKEKMRRMTTGRNPMEVPPVDPSQYGY